MTGQNDVDIPETGAIFTFGKSSFADNVPSKFWLRSDLPVHISCGGEHTAVITENGRLLIFGENASGQLGLGFKPAACKPASVKALKSEKMKLVACGRDHTIACSWQGCVYAAGSNQMGQLGLGHCHDTGSFLLLQPFCDSAPIRMLSAGCNTSAALTEDGRLFMWGDNSVGQIGLGGEGFVAEPREVNVGEAVVWVSCGSHHSAFVTADGDLYTFGEHANGRLGLQVEQLANHRVPQRVQGILGRVTKVSCGGAHTVALTEESVYTFGRGQYGQLGHGTFLFEVDLPKRLEHFADSSVQHVACGENHTAVITNTGHLYTFGDGRHGKLGFGEENYINQFNPTLCTRFLKYNVELVSCGGNHMLVLAAPRPDNQTVPPEKDVTFTEKLQESNYSDIVLLDTWIDPNLLIPLSALSARARHREKAFKLFREMFHNLPRLNSGFLNTTWQTSRNIPATKTLSKDTSSPSSSPKPQSEVTASPPFSPRSLPRSPQSPLIPSKPPSSHSQSSNKFHPNSEELPSPLLSPKSITHFQLKSPTSPKKLLKKGARRMATAKKALREKTPSPLAPEEHCSPSRASSTASSKQEPPASPLTEGETTQGQIVIEDMEELISEKGDDSDFLPKTERRKKGRAARKALEEPEVFVQLPPSTGKAFPSSLSRTEVSPSTSIKNVKKPKAASKGKENITKWDKSPDRQPEKRPSRSKSKLSESIHNAPHSVRKTPTKAQQRLTELKENDNRNLRESNTKKEGMKASAFEKVSIKTPKKEKSKLAILRKKSPVLEVAKENRITSMPVPRGSSTSAENAVKEDRESTDVKPLEEETQRETQRVKGTPTRDLHKDKSALGKSKSKALHGKSDPVKKDSTPATTPSQAGGKKPYSAKSTPVKVKGKTDKVKTPLVQNHSKSAENTPVKVKSKGKVAENDLNFAKSGAQKVKGKTANKKTGDVHSSESKVMPKTKLGGAEAKDVSNSKDDVRSGQRGASSLLLSQQDAPAEVASEAISSQSPKRSEVLSVSNAQPVDPFVSESSTEDDQGSAEEKPRWGEILSSAAALLPAVGMAGATVGILSEAVSSLGRGQSAGETVLSTPTKTSQVRQFTKQSAVTQPSFSSTLSHLSSIEASNAPEEGGDVPVNINKSEAGNAEEEGKDTVQDESLVKREMSRQISSGDISGTEVKSHDSDMETSQIDDQRKYRLEEDNEAEEEGSKNGQDTTTSDEEEKKHEGSERSDSVEEMMESVFGEDEEENDAKTAEGNSEEETSSSDDEAEEEGSEKSGATDAEEEEEEEDSSEESGDGGSDSEVDAVAQQEESQSDESSDDEEEDEVSEEEDESGEESGSAGSKSKESEQEEDSEGGDAAESGSEEEEHEEAENDAGSEEENNDQDSSEGEEAEATGTSEGEEEEEQEELSAEDEEEKEESSESDEEEEGREESSSNESEEEEGEGEEPASLDEEEAEDDEEEVSEGKEEESQVEGSEEEESKGDVSGEDEEEEEGESKEDGSGEEEEEEEEDVSGEDEEEEESKKDSSGEEEEESQEEGSGEEEEKEEEESKEGSSGEEEEKEEEERKEDGSGEEEEESKAASSGEEEEESKEDVSREDEEEEEEESMAASSGEEEEESKEGSSGEEEEESKEDGSGEEEEEEEEESKEESLGEEEEESEEVSGVEEEEEEEENKDISEEEEESKDEVSGQGEEEEEEENEQNVSEVEEEEGEEEKSIDEGEAEEEEGEEEEEQEEEEEEEEEEVAKTKDENIKAIKNATLESEEEEEEGEEEDEETDEEEESQAERKLTTLMKAKDVKQETKQKQSDVRKDSESEEGEVSEDEEEEESEEEVKSANSKENKGAKEKSPQMEEEEEEEEEGDEEEEEEEEEEEAVKSTNRKQVQRQTLPSGASSSGRKDKLKAETPKPAPRTKQAAADQKKPEDPQRFWNNVLPQYLDLQ
ncbi:uncharacterized protein V6R79_021559 [Siganus canaliculatus]